MLHYAGLFACNALKCGSQHVSVVIPDRGHHRARYPLNDVGRIKTGTDSTLDYCIVDLLLRKLQEGYHGDDAEKTHEDLIAFDHVKYLPGVVNHFFLANFLTVDYHPFTEGVNMWRGEQPSFKAELFEGVGRFYRYGALTVGACDVN